MNKRTKIIDDNTTPLYMTIEQAVNYSGLSKAIIWDLQKHGELKPIVKIAGKKLKGYRYTKAMLDNLSVEVL
jgi:glutathione peroxidase-family protein